MAQAPTPSIPPAPPDWTDLEGAGSRAIDEALWLIRSGSPDVREQAQAVSSVLAPAASRQGWLPPLHESGTATLPMPPTPFLRAAAVGIKGVTPSVAALYNPADIPEFALQHEIGHTKQPASFSPALFADVPPTAIAAALWSYPDDSLRTAILQGKTLSNTHIGELFAQLYAMGFFRVRQ